jgi:hypothetical protein
LNRVYCPLLPKKRLCGQTHELAQGTLRGGVAAHAVRVHAERERRVGVPDLIHRGARVCSERNEQGCERVPQLVRRERFGQRSLAAFLEPLVRTVDRGREDALADVRRAMSGPRRRLEYVIAALGAPAARASACGHRRRRWRRGPRERTRVVGRDRRRRSAPAFGLGREGVVGDA